MTAYTDYRERHTPPGGTIAILDQPRRVFSASQHMRCYMFDKEWVIEDAIYIERNEQSVYAGCPVCAAHGVRSSHLVYADLAPVPGECIGWNNETAPANQAETVQRLS